MKTRLISNWATTILGVILMLVAIYMYLNPDFTATEAASLSTISLIFLRSKDSLIGLSPKDE